MAKKFKVGELCLIATNIQNPDPSVVPYLGETVEVIQVASLFSPIRSNGQKWDYQIAPVNGRTLVCMELALRKRPPPNDPGSMQALTYFTGWAPNKREKARS